MFKGFREFIARGNVVDMAIGIVIGLAFAAVVASFVKDVLMPPIGLLLGHVDFSNLFAVLRSGSAPGPYPSLAEAQRAGAVTINYGVFLNTVVSFLIIALAVYVLLQFINRLRKVQAPRTCPYCYSSIPPQATRCPQCTSALGEATNPAGGAS